MYAHAQAPSGVFERATVPGFAPIAHAAAWVDAVHMYGGEVSEARAQLVSTLIAGLKTDALWQRIDRLWLHAAEDQVAGLVDIKALARATVVGQLVFIADSGFTGTGSFPNQPTDYIDSGWAENFPGNQFVQNSGHIASWIVTGGLGYFAGQIGHVFEDTSTILDNTFGNFVHSDVTDSQGEGPNYNYAPGGDTGLFMNCRVDANNLILYRNGVQVATASSPSGPPAPNFWGITCALSGSNDGPGPQTSTSGITAMTSAGGALTATQAAQFYARLRSYMTAIGVP